MFNNFRHLSAHLYSYTLIILYFFIFCLKNLHMSKKSSTFAVAKVCCI